MSLEQLLEQSKFQIPSINNTDKLYVEFLEEVFADYNDALENEPDLLDDLSHILRDKDSFLKLIETNCSEIIKIIREYNGGNHSDAYISFKNYMQRMSYFLYSKGNAEFRVTEKTFFYRCKYFTPREEDVISPIKEQSYFFHAPFNVQSEVGPTRFSSSGFPSLYLTNSMVVGYLETRAKDINNFQAVKFQNKIPLTLLDLDYRKPTKSEKVNNLEKYEKDLQYKALLLPLFFSCFTMYDGDSWIPNEYIIPQFISTWNKETRLFDGIRYPSTKTNNKKYSGKFYNVILHPKVIKDSGYCDWLKFSAFNMSKVCSWHHQNVGINDFFESAFPASSLINENIKYIEWPLGNGSVLYELTELGKMEFYIRHNSIMLPKKISF